jgi:hypothetical protein
MDARSVERVDQFVWRHGWWALAVIGVGTVNLGNQPVVALSGNAGIRRVG